MFLLLSGTGSNAAEKRPDFANVTVHDPSVIKLGRTWYVFGSHMAAAKSDDLMRWTQVSRDAGAGNTLVTLVPNVEREMKEALLRGRLRARRSPERNHGGRAAVVSRHSG